MTCFPPLYAFETEPPMQAVSLDDILSEAPEREHTAIKRALAKVPVEHQASIRSLAREMRYEYAGVGVAGILTIIMILVKNLPLILRLISDLPALFDLIRDLFSEEMWPVNSRKRREGF